MFKGLTTGFITAAIVGGALSFMGSSAGIDLGLLPALVGGIFGIFAGYIAFNLSGTKGGATVSGDVKTSWLAFNTPAAGAAIYLVRTGFVGKIAGMNITLGGQTVAQLKSPQFTRIEVAPGKHQISTAMSGGAGAQANASTIDLDLGEGEIAILHLTLSMGALKNQVSIAQMSPDTAAAMLNGAKAVAPISGVAK
jgi:hypothetical protein